MDTAGSSKLLRFGVFEADPRTGELRKAGRRVGLQEQPFKVLVTLLERPGEMLSREELRDRLWTADTFVDFDTGLNKAIRKIREVLGDSAESPVFIETLPRRGYRFIAPVETVWLNTDAPSPPEPIAVASSPNDSVPLAVPAVRASEPSEGPVGARVRRHFLPLAVAVVGLAGLVTWGWLARNHSPPTFSSIAVLPLENLSDSPDQEYFADGITDELITELAKISSLRVISRTSVLRFRRTRLPLQEIARELGAASIVEGTVQRAGDRIRVRAQLIDAQKDRHIWAQSYEESLGDVLALEGRVARDIAVHVNAGLTGGQQGLAPRRAINPQAYENYLKGRFFYYNKRSVKDAMTGIDLFERAIELQPDYAEAYAGIAEAYVLLGWDQGVLPPSEAFPKAKAAALKALEIDPSSSAAHVALMWVELVYEWNWADAEKEIKKAIQLTPNFSMAHHHYSRLLAFTGRFEEALAESKRSVELDPLDPIAGGSVAWNSYLARRYDASIQQSLRMIEMYPELPGYYSFIGWCDEAQGRFPEAIRKLQEARERRPLAWPIADLGHAYGASGNREAALNIVKEMSELSRQRYVSPYYFALVYAGMHENDRAMEWLEKAFQEHCPSLVFLKTEPRLDPLRSDRRFSELLLRVGFPVPLRRPR